MKKKNFRNIFLLSCISCGFAPLSAQEVATSLKAVRVVTSPNEIQAEGFEGPETADVNGVPASLQEPINQVIKNYIGTVLNEENLKGLCADMRVASGGYLVDVTTPEQDISNGCVQVLLIEGKLGRLCIEGNCWFSDKLLLDQIRLCPGDCINQNRLLADLDWLNRNPYRRVDLVYRPGEKPCETDITLQVEDKFPVRIYSGYDNYGNRFTGFNRFFAGMSWGNVFGLDHFASYQYTTDIHARKLQSHAVEYSIPFSWHHLLHTFGAYESSKTDSEGDFKLKGKFWQASGEYIIPLSPHHNYRHEMDIGYDFKSVTNNLFFDVATAFHRRYEISQFSINYDLYNQGRCWEDSFSITGVVSPGHMTDRNNNETFSEFRHDAKSTYVYFRGAYEHDHELGCDWKWVARLAGQGSFQRLMVSEQFGIGGFNTVRGFEEREANGDQGWFMNQEIHTPPTSFSRYCKTRKDYLYFLAFWDVGQVFNNRPPRGEHHISTLMSAGLGFRYSLRDNVFVRVDYGYPIEHSHVSHHKLPQRVNMMATIGF